jgi:two-component system chemotaxis response regulator CheB
MDELRVLIADKSPLYRRMFAQAIAKTVPNNNVTIVTEACEALGLIRNGGYDIIIIDTEITDNGFIGMLDNIIISCGEAFVLVVARPSKANDKLLSEITANGATECLVKPIHENYEENLSVVEHILDRIVCKVNNREINTKVNKNVRTEIVLIAASTGGPRALEAIIPKLDGDFPVPILVAQHITPQFAEVLALRLNKKSKLTVKLAEEGEQISAGTVYIAPGGQHMKLDANNKLRLTDKPKTKGISYPSADVLFCSVAECLQGESVLVVILSGMGKDGCNGVKVLKTKKQCVCLAQSERTSVIYGMPRAVTEEGFADKVVDLDKIHAEMTNLLKV